MDNSIAKEQDLQDIEIEIYRKEKMKQITPQLIVSGFILGLITYLGFTLIGISAQANAQYFHEENLMASFQGSLVFFGFFTQILNSFFLMKVNHMYKMTFIAVCWSIAFFIYFLAFQVPIDKGFVLAIIATLLEGSFTSVAMNTISGFLKAFHPGSIGGLTSGVGFSGLVISVFYLVVQSFLEFQWICLIVIPSFLIYLVAFYWMISLKAQVEKDVAKFKKFKIETLMIIQRDTLYGSQRDQEEVEVEVESNAKYSKLREEKKVLEEPQKNEIIDKEAKVNNNLSLKAFQSVIQTVGWPIFNLSCVFFIKYFCMNCISDLSTQDESEDPTYIQKNAYAIVIIGYHVGSFSGKSTLPFFVLKKIEFASAIMTIFLFSYAPFVYYVEVPIWGQFLAMVFVGFVGGVAYCSCFYLILENKDLEKKNKELAMFINNFMNDIGIEIATLVAIIISSLKK